VQNFQVLPQADTRHTTARKLGLQQLPCGLQQQPTRHHHQDSAHSTKAHPTKVVSQFSKIVRNPIAASCLQLQAVQNANVGRVHSNITKMQLFKIKY
jgi:hypothetical protein